MYTFVNEKFNSIRVTNHLLMAIALERKLGVRAKGGS